MSWLGLAEQLLQPLAGRTVALEPALDHARLQQRALRLAGALQARGVQRVALYLEDAGDLAIALLGAWRAGVAVLLPADAQAQSRQRLAEQTDLWLDNLDGLDGEALSAAALDLDGCRLTLCTSGSSATVRPARGCSSCSASPSQLIHLSLPAGGSTTQRQTAGPSGHRRSARCTASTSSAAPTGSGR